MTDKTIDYEFVDKMKTAIVITEGTYWEDKDYFDDKAKTEEKELMISNINGSYSCLFIKNGLVYKITHDECAEVFPSSDLLCFQEDEDFDFYFSSYSEGEVLMDIQNEEFFPKLHHFAKGEHKNISVIDEVDGTSLDFVTHEVDMDKFKSWLDRMIRWTLSKGWVPVDLAPRNIFVDKHGDFKCIDLNLFQKIEEFKLQVESTTEFHENKKSFQEFIGENGEKIHYKFFTQASLEYRKSA